MSLASGDTDCGGVSKHQEGGAAGHTQGCRDRSFIHFVQLTYAKHLLDAGHCGNNIEHMLEQSSDNTEMCFQHLVCMY